MSEPNDTAQEGFDQLKRNLEVRYPEDSDLSLDEFLNVESLLALAVRVCGPGADPRKADRLLSNYQLIRPETIGADGPPHADGAPTPVLAGFIHGLAATAGPLRARGI